MEDQAKNNEKIIALYNKLENNIINFIELKCEFIKFIRYL